MTGTPSPTPNIDAKTVDGFGVEWQRFDQSGLPQEELLARLSRELPAAVDKYTPDGRIPS